MKQVGSYQDSQLYKYFEGAWLSQESLQDPRFEEVHLFAPLVAVASKGFGLACVCVSAPWVEAHLIRLTPKSRS